MNIKVIFGSNNNIVYPVNCGSVFNDEFSETLDSATIIVSKVEQTNRLFIEPYGSVYIYDEDDSSFKKIMLIDNYEEKEINLEEHIYQYTINLMSQTKMLEKIQCPNLTITHSLVSGQKSILYYIVNYWNLYIPKIKFTSNGTTWSYQPIYSIDYSVGSELYNKFNGVLCRDMSFSQPTLRQVITNLMLQVGCIPSIINNTLSFIDLRALQSDFNVSDYSVNYVSKSMSSDSFVNELVGMQNNVLDEKNDVVNEVIGFRDNDSVFIKQQSNLKLNTRYAIYSIDNLTLYSYIKTNFSYKWTDANNGSDINSPKISSFSFSGKTATIRIGASGTYPYSYSNVVFRGAIAYNIQYSNGKAKVIESKQLDSVLYGNTGTDWVITFETDVNNIAIYCADEQYDHADTTTGVKTHYSGVFYDFTYFIGDEHTTSGECLFLYKKDITPLCVENSKRQCLDTNFLAMQNVNNINELSQYIYGTVGYSIGGKTIEGFSQTYSKSVGWWSETKTYIENIWNVIKKEDNVGELYNTYKYDFWGGSPRSVLTFTDEEIYNYNPNNVSSNATFSNLFFGIIYKPLNEIHVKFGKNKDKNIVLEQLDTSESAITSFDDLAENETDKVERLGNDVLVINQRTENASEIQSLNTLYDVDYVVFKRTMSVGESCFKVNYYASKNYVIKNYFTSIQTKYRAYEYVDYNNAVIRKENQKVYVLISSEYLNGDDVIQFANNYAPNNKDLTALFFSAIEGNANGSELIYGVESSNFYTSYKNDLSVITYKNNLVFSFKEFDNASYGSYISNPYYDDALGGLPQQRYIYASGFKTGHIICFSSGGNYIIASPIWDYGTEAASCNAEIAKIYNEPKIDLSDSTIVSGLQFMFLVDNNKITSPSRSVYLDNGEVLSQTIQFEYYTNVSNIKWTDKLQDCCVFKVGKDVGTIKMMYFTDETSFENFGNNSRNGVLHSNILSLDIENKRIVINWALIPEAKWLKIMIDNNDVIAFKRNNESITDVYYISLNDTRTTDVGYRDSNGLLVFNKYGCKMNTYTRIVEAK